MVISLLQQFEPARASRSLCVSGIPASPRVSSASQADSPSAARHDGAVSKLAFDNQQLSGKHGLSLRLEDMRKYDQVGKAGLILQGDEDDPGRRARTLPVSHQASRSDTSGGIQFLEVCRECRRAGQTRA